MNKTLCLHRIYILGRRRRKQKEYVIQSSERKQGGQRVWRQARSHWEDEILIFHSGCACSHWKFDQRLKEAEGASCVDLGGRQFQAEGTASKKSLAWGCSSHVPETAGLVWKECGDPGRVRSERGNKRGRCGLCRLCVGFHPTGESTAIWAEKWHDLT